MGCTTSRQQPVVEQQAATPPGLMAGTLQAAAAKLAGPDATYPPSKPAPAAASALEAFPASAAAVAAVSGADEEGSSADEATTLERPCMTKAFMEFEEQARMEAVRRLGVLDTEPELRFDSITTLMAAFFGVPVAVVSLIDHDRLWFKSVAGQFPKCISRAGSFCNAVLAPATPELLVIEDTLQDARFRHAPVVEGPPNVRFFVGTPLVATCGGHRLGTLCIIDFQPRQFTVEQYNMLCHFGEITVRELEREQIIHWQSVELRSANAASSRMLRAIESISDGLVLCDVSHPNWPILYENSAFEEATGVNCSQQATGTTGFWQAFTSCGQLLQNEESSRRVLDAIAHSQSFTVEVRVQGAEGPVGPPFTLELRPADTEQLCEAQPHVGVPAQVEASSTAPGPALAAALGHGKAEALAQALVKEQPNTLQLSSPVGKGAAAGLAASLVQAGTGAHTPPPLLYRQRSDSDKRVYYFGILKQSQPQTKAPAAPELPSSCTNSSNSTNGSRVVSSGAVRGGVVAKPAEAFSAHDPGVAGGKIPAFYSLRPEVLSEVTLGPLIGTGSSGRCYRGMWQGGRVAVKILDSWLDASAVNALQRSHSVETEFRCTAAAVVEALLSRSLSHPHIVSTFAAGVATEIVESSGKLHQQVWIVQGYCNRGTLLNACETGAFLTPQERPDLAAILATAQEIAGAMSHLHSSNVLHGDLTGKNVLLVSSAKDSRRWVAQVADFGLAQTGVHEGGGYKSSSFGTVTHMPPEVLADGRTSQAADVYSFGCLLCEMWTGKRAWAGQGPVQVLHKVAVLRQVLQAPADAPEGLHHLMHRCLSPDPAARPPFSQILSEVSAMLKAQRAHAPSKPAPGAGTARPVRGHQPQAGGVGKAQSASVCDAAL